MPEVQTADPEVSRTKFAREIERHRAQEEYHRGMFFDQYIFRANLKQGENTLLLKVCQNEQTEDWAQVWAFQLRICDLTGRGLNSAEERTAARDD